LEAIIFIGIQATGKSTFYKENFFKSHMRINLDMLKTRARENIFFDACIRAKQPFVIDNTNPAVENRKKYIDVAREAGFRVIGYYFQSNIKDAITRNENRTGKECVPVRGIGGTYNKLVLPAYDEGFDKLYYVSIREDNNFVVEEWKNGL
jgi:predicted kinase